MIFQKVYLLNVLTNIWRIESKLIWLIWFYYNLMSFNSFTATRACTGHHQVKDWIDMIFPLSIGAWAQQKPPQPEVTVTPKMAVVNKGGTFRAECAFPGITTLDVVNYYRVQWHKDGKNLTFLSGLDASNTDDRFKNTVGNKNGDLITNFSLTSMYSCDGCFDLYTGR